MNKMNWKRPLVCAAALVGATVLLDAMAWAGKPGGGGGTTLVNPTPIVYQIQFWDSPIGRGVCAINGTNNLGQTVGHFGLPDDNPNASDARHAYLHDPNASDPTSVIDIHAEMVEHKPWLFEVVPDKPLPIINGWVIAGATDINDLGVIVGYLYPEPLPSDVKFRRGYVLDTGASLDASTWTFSLLPTGDWSYPEQINEYGDIAGQYRRPDLNWDAYFISADTGQVKTLGRSIVSPFVLMNNPIPGRAAQIAGTLSDATAFRWTTSSDTPVIFNLDRPWVWGINDSGTICGSTRATFSNKGRTSTYAMRYNGTQLDIWSNMLGTATSINSAGDLVRDYNGVPEYRYLYHESWGFVRLDALIDPEDPNAVAWFSGVVTHVDVITDRITTDPEGDETTEFGLVSGGLGLANGNHVEFLLTPVKKVVAN